MSKIPRKIVQAVLRSGGKALTRLANSRIGEKLDRKNRDLGYKEILYHSPIEPSRLKLGKSDKIIRDTTKFLLDKKLITPRQARTVANMPDMRFDEDELLYHNIPRKWSLSRLPKKTNQTTPKPRSMRVKAIRDAESNNFRARHALDVSEFNDWAESNYFEAVRRNNPDFNGWGDEWGDEWDSDIDWGYEPFSNEQLDRIVRNEWDNDGVHYPPLDDEQLNNIARLRTRELQSKKREDLALNAALQQHKNYRVGRELLSVLGKAGLSGLAGAQLASSIALGNKEKSESKNKSSDVKKMANRRNKYFS